MEWVRGRRRVFRGRSRDKSARLRHNQIRQRQANAGRANTAAAVDPTFTQTFEA